MPRSLSTCDEIRPAAPPPMTHTRVDELGRILIIKRTKNNARLEIEGRIRNLRVQYVDESASWACKRSFTRLFYLVSNIERRKLIEM